MSPDHRLYRRNYNVSAEISSADDPPVSSLNCQNCQNSCTNCAFSIALPPTHPSIHHSGGPSSPAESEMSLLSVCPMPVHAASQPPSYSSSSFSLTVVQDRLDFNHDLAEILLF